MSGYTAGRRDASQAYATEIDRLRREVEFEANGEQFNHDWMDLSQRPCACLPTGVELSAGWSLPQCSVHPTAREEGEERSGRDLSDQASREDIAAKTLGRGLTTSGEPGPGDVTATPAPLSSRSTSGSQHPDGDDATLGPVHPDGSTEGHFQSAPQRGQQHAESTPALSVHPDGSTA